jgi:catalase
MNQIQQRMMAREGGEKRGFHTKQHGCWQGQVRVLSASEIGATSHAADLSPGLFGWPSTYKAWVRFSNGQHKTQADAKPDVRGLAIKIIGVKGAQLTNANATTQDLLMTNAPDNLAKDASGFMEFARASSGLACADANDTLCEAGTLAKYLVQNPSVDAFFARRTTLPVRSMLRESFWSGGPFKMGQRAAKILAKPCKDPDYQAHLEDKPLVPDLLDASYLKQDLLDSVTQHDLCYDLYVQFQVDPVQQPIEDGTVVWDETDAPPLRVARVTVPKWADAVGAHDQETAFCEQLSFAPWHGLKAHRPLGNLNRARQQVYSASASFRHYVGAEPDGTETFH